MTDAPTLIARLHAAVPGAPVEAGPAADQPTLYVPAGDLVAVARALRDDLGFVYLADLAGVDFWPAEPRFEMVYHLAALDPPSRLRLKIRVPGGAPNVPSLTPLWPSADWLEREVWDLIGITFDGHGDLRRLLMPEDWEGHPLRKDHPVQINLPARTSEPLQLTEAEFRASIERDRQSRDG